MCITTTQQNIIHLCISCMHIYTLCKPLSAQILVGIWISSLGGLNALVPEVHRREEWLSLLGWLVGRSAGDAAC